MVNKLLLQFAKKHKQQLDMGGMWDDVMVDDVTKVIVREDFNLNDILFTKDTEIKGVTVFYDLRMTQKQIDHALIDYYSGKMDEYLGNVNLKKGVHSGT